MEGCESEIRTALAVFFSAAEQRERPGCLSLRTKRKSRPCLEDQLRMHCFSVQSSKHTQTHIVEALVSGSGILGPSSSLAVIGSEASGLTRQPGGWGEAEEKNSLGWRWRKIHSEIKTESERRLENYN